LEAGDEVEAVKPAEARVGGAADVLEVLSELFGGEGTDGGEVGEDELVGLGEGASFCHLEARRRNEGLQSRQTR
jgi:hypothetical protein